MKRFVAGWSGVVAVAALLGAGAAWAQDRGHQAGGGGAGSGGAGGTRVNDSGGGSRGTAVSRDGGGYDGGSSLGTATATGGGFAGGTGGGFAGGGGGTTPSYYAPSPMGNHGLGRAGARGRAGGAIARLRNEAAASANDRAVPGGSRPNYGRPTTGAAVSRPAGGNQGGGTSDPDYWYYSGSPYYYGYAGYYGYSGYGAWGSLFGPYWFAAYDPDCLYGYGSFGLGSFYYDPSWFGYQGMYPYGSHYAGGGGTWQEHTAGAAAGPRGAVKLKVQPRDAEVVVDGSFAGTVDDYDGIFQRLELPPGAHRLELRKAGFESLAFDVNVLARETLTFRGTLAAVPPAR